MKKKQTGLDFSEKAAIIGPIIKSICKVENHERKVK